MTDTSSSRQPRALRLDPSDNVLVATADLSEGTEVASVCVTEDVPVGHKLCASAIDAGEPVVKFGQIIGFASQPIAAGSHVHVHNCAYGEFDRRHEVGAEYRPTQVLPEEQQARFQGIVRADGRVATRNMLGVVTTVNCSATVARAVVDRIRQRGLSQYENVDDVVAFTHSGGCGIGATGENIDILRRTLTGMMRHPNLAGVLLLGLGCESNQGDALLASAGLSPGQDLEFLTIQGVGGSRSALDRGVDALSGMLARANDVRRQPVSARHLTLALQCGGSDGYSGVTANPALGVAVDLLVKNGGTAILAETPEVYGAEQLLTGRAASPEVASKLLERIAWWEKHVEATGGSMNNNPSHGNKKGGLTTILEKSLGAVAKAGTTGLMGVYEYGESVDTHGLVFMDSPGNDPYSITGQLASGANLVCFTTGRGSVYGSKPAPCLKLTTNTATYQRMQDDMDVNCGVVVDGTATLPELGQQIFERLLEVASGSKTKSEEFGFGDNEFLPWRVGAVM